jgi:hypothetical protein
LCEPVLTLAAKGSSRWYCFSALPYKPPHISIRPRRSTTVMQPRAPRGRRRPCALVEAPEAGALNCANVHKGVFAAALGRDEAKAFCAIEGVHRPIVILKRFRVTKGPLARQSAPRQSPQNLDGNADHSAGASGPLGMMGILSLCVFDEFLQLSHKCPAYDLLRVEPMLCQVALDLGSAGKLTGLCQVECHLQRCFRLIHSAKHKDVGQALEIGASRSPDFTDTLPTIARRRSAAGGSAP